MPFSNAFPMVYFFPLRRVHPIKHLSGRAVSLLHLIGAFFRLRQPENNAPKTTYNFHWRSISGSNENYKRFSKYGDRCQAPFQAAWKLFSTSCISSIFPHRPLVVQKIKNIQYWFIYVLAVSAHITSPLRSWFFVHFATLIHYDSLHSILPSFSAFTSAPHSLGSFLPFHSASSIHQSVTTQTLSHAFPAACFYFQQRVSPNQKILRFW